VMQRAEAGNTMFEITAIARGGTRAAGRFG
jgi:hypothetical protein